MSFAKAQAATQEMPGPQPGRWPKVGHHLAEHHKKMLGKRSLPMRSANERPRTGSFPFGGTGDRPYNRAEDSGPQSSQVGTGIEYFRFVEQTTVNTPGWEHITEPFRAGVISVPLDSSKRRLKPRTSHVAPVKWGRIGGFAKDIGCIAGTFVPGIDVAVDTACIASSLLPSHHKREALAMPEVMALATYPRLPRAFTTNSIRHPVTHRNINTRDIRSFAARDSVFLPSASSEIDTGRRES